MNAHEVHDKMLKGLGRDDSVTQQLWTERWVATITPQLQGSWWTHRSEAHLWPQLSSFK